MDNVSYFTHIAMMRYLTLDETLLVKTLFEPLENYGGLLSNNIERIMDASQTKYFTEQCKKSIKIWLSVQLEVTIKMELLRERSRSSPWLFVPSYYTQFVTGPIISQRWCGRFHSKKLHSVWTSFLFEQMEGTTKQHYLVSMEISLSLKCFIPLAAHVLY